jgi:hypothetical protein
MAGLSIELTHSAEQAYKGLRDQAQARQHPTSVIRFQKLKELLHELGDCPTPFAPERALMGMLSSVFRVDNGIVRVYYTGTGGAEARNIIVIHIDQQVGPRSTPYSVFAQLMLSGRFNEVLAGLGLTIPEQCQGGPSPRLQ